MQALEYIHALGESLGRYDRRATTGLGTTTTLVCADLANSMFAASKLARFSVLIEDGACAGEVGLVTDAGLAKSTGTLTIGDSFSSAIASGVTFSLYDADRLPPTRKGGGKPGLLEVVNRALRETLWIERTITLTGVSGQKRYAISRATYPWLTSADRIIEVRYPTTAADDVTVSLCPDRWDFEVNAETIELVFPTAPFETGQTATVKVYLPASSRLVRNAALRAVLSTTTVGSVTVVAGGYYAAVPTVAASGGGGSGAAFTAVLSGGTSGSITGVTVTNAGTGYTSVPTLTVTRAASDAGWADTTSQTGGLATVFDEALSDVEDVRAVGTALAFEVLAEMGASGQTVAEWLGKAQVAHAYANGLPHVGLPSNPRTNVATIRTAPVYGRRGGYGWPYYGRRAY